MNNFEHGYAMGFGWLIPLLLAGLVFYFIRAGKEDNTSAKDILDKRYASGEIEKKEYAEKSQQLKK